SAPIPAPAAAPMTVQAPPPALVPNSTPVPAVVAAPQPEKKTEPSLTPKKLPHVRIGPPPAAIAQSPPSPAPLAPRAVPPERETVEATPAPLASDPAAARVHQFLPAPSRWLQPRPSAEEPVAAVPPAPMARELAMPTI